MQHYILINIMYMAHPEGENDFCYQVKIYIDCVFIIHPSPPSTI